MVFVYSFFYFIVLISPISFAEEEYYLTLRNDQVNLRQGPSLNYPIKLVYNKKFLPILIKDKSGNFRKVLDHENNSGWIHISQLSKKRAALSILDELIVFQKPLETYSHQNHSGLDHEDFFTTLEVQNLSKRKYHTEFASGSTIASVNAM